MGRYNHADTVRVSVRATLLLSDVASLMTLAMHVDNMLQRLKKIDERQILWFEYLCKSFHLPRVYATSRVRRPEASGLCHDCPFE